MSAQRRVVGLAVVEPLKQAYMVVAPPGRHTGILCSDRHTAQHSSANHSLAQVECHVLQQCATGVPATSWHETSRKPVHCAVDYAQCAGMCVSGQSHPFSACRARLPVVIDNAAA